MAIIKLSSLKAARECEKQGLLVEKEMIVVESTMVTNFMMVYNGYTPASALLGVAPRELYDPENLSISGSTGSMETSLDFVETHVRTRFVIKE